MKYCLRGTRQLYDVSEGHERISLSLSLSPRYHPTDHLFSSYHHYYSSILSPRFFLLQPLSLSYSLSPKKRESLDLEITRLESGVERAEREEEGESEFKIG